ncbi:MAG: serine--tRNA ligase, partial [Anaerolineaceae bacterium]|nr:serine--tRNA ligase [Anaerolineaceae bacterium]
LQLGLPGMDASDDRGRQDTTHQMAIPGLSSLEDAMQTLVAALRGMSEQYSQRQAEIRATETALRDEMLWLPNLPHASVPVAASEDDNRPWTPEGNFRFPKNGHKKFDAPPLPHWELGPALGLIDFERGVKIAGSRGYVLKGDGARLQQALIHFFLDQARDGGYEQVYVPYMVPSEMLFGAGQFPKFQDTVYKEEHGGRYMLPTAEVALTNLHRDEILDESELPLKYVAHSPCFRREHMSAGRDTRGIKRVHQFEKVEMYLFTTPEQSYDALEALTEAAENLCRALDLPFRRLEIVSGDLGFSASKKYDVEVYAPGCDEWLEVSSCSNTEAFQARRANIRFRREGVRRPLHVHTLNGSGLALPRVIIAILENYQKADGSVDLPEVLVDYMGGQRVISVSQE